MTFFENISRIHGEHLNDVHRVVDRLKKLMNCYRRGEDPHKLIYQWASDRAVTYRDWKWLNLQINSLCMFCEMEAGTLEIAEEIRQ